MYTSDNFHFLASLMALSLAAQTGVLFSSILKFMEINRDWDQQRPNENIFSQDWVFGRPKISLRLMFTCILTSLQIGSFSFGNPESMARYHASSFRLELVPYIYIFILYIYE